MHQVALSPAYVEDAGSGRRDFGDDDRKVLEDRPTGYHEVVFIFVCAAEVLLNDRRAELRVGPDKTTAITLEESDERAVVDVLAELPGRLLAAVGAGLPGRGFYLLESMPQGVLHPPLW